MKYFGETEQDRVGAVGDDESCFLAAKYLTSSLGRNHKADSCCRARICVRKVPLRVGIFFKRKLTADITGLLAIFSHLAVCSTLTQIR